jgi:fermentation-respiration switch protein FrsA (DUF1100 family)
MKGKREIRESVTLVSGGLKVFGMLHLPVDHAGKAPCVVIFHGFGGNKSGRYRLITRLAEMLAESGIAAFRIDYRGSGDSEGAFYDTTLETLAEDAEAALDYVSCHPSIDAACIGICGRSLGGVVASCAAARFLKAHPHSIRAVALWAPVFDAKPWAEKASSAAQLSTTLRSAGDNKTFYFLGEELHPEFIRQFRSYSAPDALSALRSIPLLVIQGEKDQTIGRYHIEQYALLREGIQNTVILTLANTDHEFSDVEEQKMALEKTIAFFKQHLAHVLAKSSREL